MQVRHNWVECSDAKNGVRDAKTFNPLTPTLH